MSEERKTPDWVERRDLQHALDTATTRAGTVAAGFAMIVTLGLPWLVWHEARDRGDDRILFELGRDLDNRYATADINFVRLTALLAVVATIICIVGAWRRWPPENVVIAPRLAALVILGALFYLFWASSRVSADVGLFVALGIQLGLSALWTWEARHYYRRN